MYPPSCRQLINLVIPLAPVDSAGDRALLAKVSRSDGGERGDDDHDARGPEETVVGLPETAALRKVNVATSLSSLLRFRKLYMVPETT